MYSKFRNEIAAGGAVDDPNAIKNNSATTLTTVFVVVGLLAWLGVKNPWWVDRLCISARTRTFRNSTPNRNESHAVLYGLWPSSLEHQTW